MPWRLIPPQIWDRLQKVILATTAIAGLSLAVTPTDRVSTLSVIERTMSADIWAYGLIICSLIALVCEWDMERRHHERWVNLVGYCHIIMCSLLVGYSVAAMVGVLIRVWWNFGAPVLGCCLAYLHFIYIRRRPRAEP